MVRESSVKARQTQQCGVDRVKAECLGQGLIERRGHDAVERAQDVRHVLAPSEQADGITEPLGPDGPLDVRPSIQGSADLLMGMSGATAGLLAGVIVALGSYALLTVIATALVVPMLIATIRNARLQPAGAPS